MAIGPIGMTMCVEYRLTAAGVKLRERVNGICTWTFDCLADIEASRTRYDEAGRP